MTPAISSIDSEKVSLGDLADYTITSAAIPVDVGDSSGSITSFTTRHSVDMDDTTSTYYAVGQHLSLTTEEEGLHEGRVTSVGVPAKGAMTLTADTVMADLAVDKRVYPIYQTKGIPKHIVAAAVDHWTQTVGLLYDKVPGKVITYHSFYGHDYVYGNKPKQRPRVQSQGVQGQNYRVDGDRVVYELRPRETTVLTSATVQEPDALIAATDNIPVPTAASGEQLMLSPAFVVGGSGHTGTMTWYMASARADQVGAKPVQMELSWSNTTGFALYLTHPGEMARTQMIAPTGALTAGHRYRVLIGLHQFSNKTSTFFNMSVVNETTNAQTAQQGVYMPTPLRGSQVQLSYASINAGPGGTGTPWGIYGYFVTSIKHEERPTVALPVTKSLAASAHDVTIVPGFDGDIWNNMKTFLSLHRMDLWYAAGKLRTGVRETAIRSTPVLSKVSPSLTQRESAKYIEVVNRNMQAFTSVPKVLFAADSVYQVATGEVQTFTTQTDHSIDTVNNPVCVSGITPYPYKEGIGQYVITGSDGYIVSPSWWLANGGNVTARTTEKEGEIEITIKGPDFDSPRSPYRVSEGDAGRAALYITGTGTISKPETLKVATGNSKAVTDIGETVDIPFITNRGLAYKAAVQVSLRYASPQLKISASEPKDGGPSVLSQRGAGALIEHDGNAYRVGSLTQTARSNSFTDAVQHTTLRHRNEAFPGRTIREANLANAGRTIKDRALKPLARS